MQVDEIGPSLRCAKAQVTRNPRGGGQGGFSGGQGGFGGNASGQGQSQQGGSGSYNNSGQQGGGYNAPSQPRYNAPSGGAADDPWATGGPPSRGRTAQPGSVSGDPAPASTTPTVRCGPCEMRRRTRFHPYSISCERR